MGDSMWVDATTTIPDDMVNPWVAGFDSDTYLEATFGDYDQLDKAGKATWDALEELISELEGWCDSQPGSDRNATIKGRTIHLTGNYNYGLEGLNDHLSFEAFCQAHQMAYTASDDGGRYEDGTWRTWDPTDGVLVELPANSDGDPVIDHGTYKKYLAGLTDSQVANVLRQIFGDDTH